VRAGVEKRARLIWGEVRCRIGAEKAVSSPAKKAAPPNSSLQPPLSQPFYTLL